MRSTPIAIGLGILAVILLVVAVLYALGALQLFASTGTGPHYKHAVLFVVLAVASLIAANFTRPKSV